METFFHILSIVVAVLFFINKLLYLIGKKTSWGIGIIAASLAIIYLIHIDMLIVATVEIGLIVYMIYGHFAHDKEAVTPKHYKEFLFIALTLIGAWSFRGWDTIWEWAGSLLMVLGVALLAKKNHYWGWIWLSVSHFIFAYIIYQKGVTQRFFADFQVASGIVGLIAWWYLSNPTRSAP